MLNQERCPRDEEEYEPKLPLIIDRIPEGGAPKIPKSEQRFYIELKAGFIDWLREQKDIKYFDGFGYLDQEEQVQLAAEYDQYCWYAAILASRGANYG